MDRLKRGRLEGSTPVDEMTSRYRRRQSRLLRLLRPPSPFVYNRRERFLPPSPQPRLFIGGAGGTLRAGYICLDFVVFPGVDVVADAQSLPFGDGTIEAIECDAVLEHVSNPERAVAEFNRVLRPGGFLHVVVPFCHPFHAYPFDFRRWTLDGLHLLLSEFEVVSSGVRTGPTATLLATFLEYLKLLAPQACRRAIWAAGGWIIWPLRYLDLWLLRRAEAHVLANSIFALCRKTPIRKTDTEVMNSGQSPASI